MIRSLRAQAFREGRELPKLADRPVAGPRSAPGRSLLANARACPYRVPVPADERVGCGCAHACHAEPTRSPLPNRGITVLECWECSIAPRLSWPDDE